MCIALRSNWGRCRNMVVGARDMAGNGQGVVGESAWIPGHRPLAPRRHYSPRDRENYWAEEQADDPLGDFASDEGEHAWGGYACSQKAGASANRLQHRNSYNSPRYVGQLFTASGGKGLAVARHPHLAARPRKAPIMPRPSHVTGPTTIIELNNV
jgi:hypothetical protein